MEDWEKQVQAAPTLAHWLGILMVTLSRRDATVPMPAGYPFTVITRTNSLRAAVRAMNADMNRTFYQIHEDFSRIQPNLAEVPVHVQAIFTLVNKTVPSDRGKQWLPYALRNIGRLVRETTSMIQTTKIRFDRISQMQFEASEFLRLSILNSTVPSDAHLSELKIQLDDIRSKWNDLKTLFNSIVNSIDSAQHETVFELIPVANYALVDGLLADDTDFDFFLQLLTESSEKITKASSIANLTMSIVDSVLYQWTVWPSDNDAQTLLALTREEDRLTRIRDFWYMNAQSSMDIARLTQKRQKDSRV